MQNFCEHFFKHSMYFTCKMKQTVSKRVIEGRFSFDSTSSPGILTFFLRRKVIYTQPLLESHFFCDYKERQNYTRVHNKRHKRKYSLTCISLVPREEKRKERKHYFTFRETNEAGQHPD